MGEGARPRAAGAPRRARWRRAAERRPRRARWPRSPTAGAREPGADRARAELDAARFADLLAGYCLDVQPGQQVLVRSTTLAAPLLLECSARSSSATRGRCCASSCPGATAASTATRATATSTTSPSSPAPRPRRRTRTLGIQAPENTRALAGDRPRAPRARGPRARRPLREQTMKQALVLDAVADAGAGAQQAGMSLDDFEAFVAARAVPRPARPGALVGRAARVPGAAHRAAEAGARELRIEADGHRRDAERQGPHVGQLRRQAQHAQRRGLHRPARGERRAAACASTCRPRRPASTSPASS